MSKPHPSGLRLLHHRRSLCRRAGRAVRPPVSSKRCDGVSPDDECAGVRSNHHIYLRAICNSKISDGGESLRVWLVLTLKQSQRPTALLLDEKGRVRADSI